MKFDLPTSVALLGAFGSSSVLAKPVANSADSAVLAAKYLKRDNVTGHAHHSKEGAEVINPGHSVSKLAAAPAVDGAKKCIQFTSDIPGVNYVNSAPWTGSGTFGTEGAEVCVEVSDSAGGAMYIGTQANPGPGNTKFECYFPSTGTANCDMSLVDGYSLSVSCHVADTTVIGGDTNLWTTGKTCDDTSAQDQGICKNDLGYAPNESDVSPFFQEALINGNNYCIWVNCGQDYFFPTDAAISCHVSGSAGPTA